MYPLPHHMDMFLVIKWYYMSCVLGSHISSTSLLYYIKIISENMSE